jgi:hypothetical protein
MPTGASTGYLEAAELVQCTAAHCQAAVVRAQPRRGTHRIWPYPGRMNLRDARASHDRTRGRHRRSGPESAVGTGCPRRDRNQRRPTGDIPALKGRSGRLGDRLQGRRRVADTPRMTGGEEPSEGAAMLADEATAASLGGRRAKVIGRPSVGVLAICGGGILGIFAFCWTALAQPPNDPSNIVPSSLLYGAVAMVLYLIGTTRVVVGRNVIELVSLVVTYKVPLDQIAGSSTNAGFQLVLVSGRRVGTMALGDSLLGQIMGQRRAHRVARRLLQSTGIGPAGALESWQQDTIAGSHRYRAAIQAACLMALLVSGAVLLNLVH